MQKIILIIALLVPYSCNKPDSINDIEKRNHNWGWFENEDTGIGEWVPIGNRRSILNGRITHFYFNGNINSTGRLRHGIRIDTTYLYHLNGDTAVLGIHDEEPPRFYFPTNGNFKIHYANGTIKEEGIVVENKASDNWKMYSKEGVLKREKFTHDTLTIIVDFYDSGQKEDSMTLWEGKKHGTFKFWNSSGKLSSIQNFIYDKRDGTHQYYHDNGFLSEKSFFIEGFREDSILKYFNNGQLEFEGQYRNDSKTGTWKYYDENGVLLKTNKFE